jgi:8-oxo-dGTP diphosphatase
MFTVVAAVIEQDGKLLICQRRRSDAAFPLKWEFPGGKMLADETPQAALVRELKEELDVTAEIGEEVFRTQHHYAEHAEPLELIFYRADLKGQFPRNLAFEQTIWALPAALPHYDFLEADREFIARFARGVDTPKREC